MITRIWETGPGEALIEAVTLDDVNRLARSLLDAASLSVVVVGKPEGVDGQRQPQ